MNEKLKQTLTSIFLGLAQFHLKLNDNTILHVHSVLKSTLCELRDLLSWFKKTLLSNDSNDENLSFFDHPHENQSFFG